MSQGQHNVADAEAMRLTLEDLKSFRYLKPLFDKFDELKKEWPYTRWEDPVFASDRRFIFRELDARQQTAYMLSIGYFESFVEERDLPWFETETSNVELFKDSLQFSLHYGSVENFCVSFDNEEITDEYLDDRYHRPFLEQEGANIVGYYTPRPSFPDDSRSVVHRNRNYAQTILDFTLNSSIRSIILSVLEKTEIQQGMTQDVFSFLQKKGALYPLEGDNNIAELAFRVEPQYDSHSGELLFGGGLNVYRDLAGSYNVELNGEQYGFMGFTALGLVKKPSIKKFFGLMQTLLRDRNQEFLDAVAARMTSGGALPSDLGNQEMFDAVGARMTWDGSIPVDLGEDFHAAVELYAVITKLVTSGVHMGVPRVMLTDSVDFLLIELDKNFHLEEPIHKSLAFPKLVRCQYRWLHRSDFFLRLTICSFLSPTLKYTKTLATFRSPVQMNLSRTITELLRSVAESLRRVPPGMDTAENRGETESMTSSAERGTGPEILSALRAKVVEAMAEGEMVQLSPTTSELQEDGTFETASSDDSLFSDSATSADTTAYTSAPFPVMAYPEEYRDKIFSTTDGVEFFDNRVFSVRDDTFKYPFYVNFGEAVKEYVQNRSLVSQQVFSVNPDVLLAYIPQPFMFNNAPQVDSAILKVYDPFWHQSRWRHDPELAFNQNGPQLQALCKNELLIYEKIVSLMGDVVPLIYSYGYMIDVSVMVGQLYKRFVGPYILMQQLKPDKGFKKSDVDLEFLQTRIIPQYKRLHELGVVHTYFGWEHMIVTEDRDVKIINFSHSFNSSNENDYKKEIGNIYRYFGYSYPGRV